MTNGPGDAAAIAVAQKLHHRVFPLLRALAEEQTGEHGGKDHGKNESAKQCERHRPCHGPEEPAFDRLQREDGQIGGDDDGDGVEDRALHFVRGLSDALLVERPVSSFWCRWRTMFSTMTTAPSTTMPKSSAPSESRLAGICFRSRQMAAKSSENGMVSGDDNGAAHVAEKEKQNDDDEDHALSQVVQDGVGGEAEQVAAVDERERS